MEETVKNLLLGEFLLPGFLAEQLEEDGSLESFSQLQRSRPKLQKVQLLDPFFFVQLLGMAHICMTLDHVLNNWSLFLGQDLQPGQQVHLE